ncbi:P-loop containing nucleoside triphosphate hydrolase protein [Dichomitus squalens]|uniref:Guanine nucleotide-binding protein-like 1 n=1 Tax=Dichomitus squalens TaxID=114155 RepID=A0A4Q9N2G6_9APHY|nr:P-loop containing nucleoside triphosphate hydrolase protein [Dichomitus squalens]
MQRRKPCSPKKRREQLRLKRAVKRGDIPPPPPSKPDQHRKGRKGPTGQSIGSTTRATAAESTRRLESSFVKLPPAFLEKTRVLAYKLPLTRPIPPELAILPDVDKQITSADGGRTAGELTCPRRPKWRYDMSKKEVEANEEGLFKKWLAQTDAAVNAWCNASSDDDAPQTSSVPGAPDRVLDRRSEAATDAMPRAPTSYEHNLEVWRQLWRVTEISQILLILLDSRCPILHFPPALPSYLSSLPHASRIRTILVLTKVDISGPDRVAAWTKHLNALYPDMRIVQVESYVEKHAGEGSSSGRKMYAPHLPSAFRETLVNALRETHAELLEPPPEIKSNPERLARWRPRMRSSVDWDAVLRARGGQVGTVVGGAADPKPTKPPLEDGVGSEGHEEDDDSDPKFLTIGLIGQPNVGKSSLLNALFGTQKVRVSRTPGKTKHFQTLFWTSEVRLVDCPGLVIPNYVPMETQVLSGILPISRVSAIPLCIYHAARLIPLEKVLGLAHPSPPSAAPEDKRTWREDIFTWRDGEQPKAQPKEVVWTAMDILTAYANKKGWMTAQAGRPDVNRAGNAST